MMLLSGMETARAENLRPVGARLLADGRCRLGLGVVHEVFQLLAGLEEGNFLGGDFDLCSSFRIAPNSSTALAGAEAAESPDFDLLSLLQGLDNAIENSFDDGFGLLPRKESETIVETIRSEEHTSEL